MGHAPSRWRALPTQPETIHDFYGFPRQLYEIQYPAPGAPDVARRAAVLLNEHGLLADTQPHGLDHGAWVPMLLMFPNADVPVAQLSIQPHMDAAHHFRVGRALRALKDDGVMVIGSGQITHNLRAADFSARPEDADPRVTEFTDWFEAKLAAHDIDALLDYRRQAPHAVLMHPTDEHLLPVFAALGAADDDYTLGDPVTRDVSEVAGDDELRVRHRLKRLSGAACRPLAWLSSPARKKPA